MSRSFSILQYTTPATPSSREELRRVRPTGKKFIVIFLADSPRKPYFRGVRAYARLIEIWERKKNDIGINNLLDIAHVP
jgi:hypothetical protein